MRRNKLSSLSLGLLALLLLLGLRDCCSSPSWSLRRLSARNLPKQLSSGGLGPGRSGSAELYRQSYGALRPAAHARIKVPSGVDIDADFIAGILKKDFVGENVMKVGTNLLVDVPARVLGRNVYPFRYSVSKSSKGSGLTLELKTAKDVGSSRLLFWKKVSCRIMCYIGFTKGSVSFRVKVSGVGMSSSQMDVISESVYTALHAQLSTEVSVRAARHAVLEKNRLRLEAQQRARQMKTLQSIMEPVTFNRLNTAPAAKQGQGQPRYSRGTESLAERRKPKGGGGS
jgi:hypothetical protein